MPGIEKAAAKKRCYEEELPPPISTIDPKLVLESVLGQLGKPSDLCQSSGCLTRATPITQFSFRVQIYRTMEVAPGFGQTQAIFPSNILTDTFFVKVNGEGSVIKSDKPIERKYGDNFNFPVHCGSEAVVCEPVK